ncbi:MAG TPA: CinA family protein [Rhizomicrobium sp.]|jgi:nicotinamide-nucleotide amidase
MKQHDGPDVSAACIDPSLVSRASDAVCRLRALGLTVVTAESCTAGLIASVLSQADGAGDVLHGAFVTYSKAQKCAGLGVLSELLEREGSVNEAVACALADGALARSPAGVALSVTGVLGPDPDEDGNPVGLVYLCCKRRGTPERIAHCEFGRQPPDILRRRTVCAALDLLVAQDLSSIEI